MKEMEQNFKGKTVLVTGAGWGIGAAIALLYSTHGANVIVSDSIRKEGKDTVAKIKSQKGDATYIKTDVSNTAACERLIKFTIDTYGSIDIACNNSAIFSAQLSLGKKNLEAFDNEVDLSITGLNNCMHYEIKAMQKQGGGVIVNTSSIVGAIGLASWTQYLTAKYGITEPLRNNLGEFRASGIRINTIAPAFFNTAILKAMIRTEKERGVKLSTVNRLSMVHKVAGLILWLSSNQTHFLSTISNGNNN